MDNAFYTTLTRQSGLMHEMRVVANNIANVSTTGFRREGLIFAEHVAAIGAGGPSLSMAHADARSINQSQGPLSATGGSLDFAIEGEGFFQIETPQGNRLTRAGNFTASAEGELVTTDGYRLLDAGGAPILLPPDAGTIRLSQEGTLSSGDGPIAQVGVFRPADPTTLTHESGTRLAFDTELEPVENATLLQGFLEDSNVDAISEIARMIEVQRAYEMGQTFLDREDERIRSTISTLTR